MTICETLVLIKAVQARIGELSSLRTYDVKIVDKKVVELRKWLTKAESAVKQSNAITQVNIPGDIDELLKSIE